MAKLDVAEFLIVRYCILTHTFLKAHVASAIKFGILGLNIKEEKLLMTKSSQKRTRHQVGTPKITPKNKPYRTSGG